MLKNVLIPIMCALSLTSLNADESDLSQNQESIIHNRNKHILEAIDHLDKACLLCQSIEDEEVQAGVSNQLRSCMKCLRKEFFSKNYKNVTEASSTLYESLGEILANCQDIQLKDDITCCIDNMMNALDK